MCQSLNKGKTDTIIRYKSRRSLICCTHYKDRSYFLNIIQLTDLSDIEKEIIQTRYISILENFKRRSRNYSYMFFIGHFIVTVGSLFVPALLSIQNSDSSYTLNNSNFDVHTYWATFVISLLVTIFNGIITLFKVDKKYYFLHTTSERLKSEGWQYFSLTGRYDGRLISDATPTHKNQFVHFMHYVEKIKMKQVEEEYYKIEEKGGLPTSNANQNAGQNDLFPPSIDQTLASMKNVPSEVETVVNSIIKSQTTVDKLKETGDAVDAVSGVSGVSGDKNVIVHVPSVSFASENKDVTNKQNARNNRK
jgi:hypothetical protein